MAVTKAGESSVASRLDFEGKAEARTAARILAFVGRNRFGGVWISSCLYCENPRLPAFAAAGFA